jgi:TonB family protein
MSSIKQAIPTLLALALAGAVQPAHADSAVVDFNSCAKPHYPQADIQARHEGAVALAFLVKTDGTVGESKVDSSSGFPTLDEAARSAIGKCRFKPATKNGKAVQEWTKVQYVWSLK